MCHPAPQHKHNHTNNMCPTMSSHIKPECRVDAVRNKDYLDVRPGVCYLCLPCRLQVTASSHTGRGHRHPRCGLTAFSLCRARAHHRLQHRHGPERNWEGFFHGWHQALHGWASWVSLYPPCVPLLTPHIPPGAPLSPAGSLPSVARGNSTLPLHTAQQSFLLWFSRKFFSNR